MIVGALSFAIYLAADLPFAPIQFGLRNPPPASVDILIVWSTIISMAVGRELLEETGYVAETIRPLARVVPNPAVQNGYLYLFVADGCRNTGKTQLDDFECIDVLESPLADIPELIRSGTISHAMVIAAFAFLGLVPKVAGR